MLYNVIQVFEVYFKYNWSTYKIIEVFGHSIWVSLGTVHSHYAGAVPKVIQSIPKSLNTTLVIHWSRERWQKHCAHRASFGKFDVLVQNQETASLTTANHIRQQSGGIPHRNGYYGYSCVFFAVSGGERTCWISVPESRSGSVSRSGDPQLPRRIIRRCSTA